MSLRLRAFVVSAVVAAGLCAPLHLAGALVSDAFVEAVAQIESGGDSQARGDSGRAMGRWQMHEAAWADTSAHRLSQGQPIWPFHHAPDASVARLYARDYLTMLENRLRKELGECVTTDMIYAAYNMGFGNLRKLGFAVENAPASTRAGCARVSQLTATLEKSASGLAKAD